jgi:hypothetical protein
MHPANLLWLKTILCHGCTTQAAQNTHMWHVPPCMHTPCCPLYPHAACAWEQAAGKIQAGNVSSGRRPDQLHLLCMQPRKIHNGMLRGKPSQLAVAQHDTLPCMHTTCPPLNPSVACAAMHAHHIPLTVPTCGTCQVHAYHMPATSATCGMLMQQAACKIVTGCVSKGPRCRSTAPTVHGTYKGTQARALRTTEQTTPYFAASTSHALSCNTCGTCTRAVSHCWLQAIFSSTASHSYPGAEHRRGATMSAHCVHTSAVHLSHNPSSTKLQGSCIHLCSASTTHGSAQNWVHAAGQSMCNSHACLQEQQHGSSTYVGAG